MMDETTGNDQIVYARARPQHVRIRELYHYSLEISANPAERPVGEPEGLIEVIVPYDGERYLSRSAMGDAQRQVGVSSRPEQVQIGHLALAEPEFPQHPDPWAGVGGRWRVEPVSLLLPSESELAAGDRRGAVRQSYTPTWPASPPVELQVSVFDDEIVAEDLQSYMQAVSQWRSSEVGLILCFTVRVVLPNWLLAEQEGQPHLDLAWLRLNWPTAPAAGQLRLWALGERPRELRWLYDPARRAVVCRKNELEWRTSPVPGRAARKFETDLLAHVLYPGDLYLQPVLQGGIGISISDILLSGRQAVYFDGLGHADGRAARRTYLTADFDIYLEDCFKQRPTATYWSLCFDGVKLDPDRVADVRSALRDLGYRLTLDKREPDGHLIRCERWEAAEGGLAQLDLLLVEHTISRTRWEQEVPGGARFSTFVPAGRLVIHLRGRLQGGSGSLSEGINRLQLMLKERLHPMAAVQ